RFGKRQLGRAGIAENSPHAKSGQQFQKRVNAAKCHGPSAVRAGSCERSNDLSVRLLGDESTARRNANGRITGRSSREGRSGNWYSSDGLVSVDAPAWAATYRRSLHPR